MIYLLKQGESYKVAETVEDERYVDMAFTELSLFLEFFRRLPTSSPEYVAIEEFLISCIEDRQKLEFHLRQKNLAE